MQGTWIWSLVREESTCCGATKPMPPQLLSPCTLQPGHPTACTQQFLAWRGTTTEAHRLQPVLLQQGKPPQREARALQRRVAPTCCNERKPAQSKEDPVQPKINDLLKTKENPFSLEILNDLLRKNRKCSWCLLLKLWTENKPLLNIYFIWMF